MGLPLLTSGHPKAKRGNSPLGTGLGESDGLEGWEEKLSPWMLAPLGFKGVYGNGCQPMAWAPLRSTILEPSSAR